MFGNYSNNEPDGEDIETFLKEKHTLEEVLFHPKYLQEVML